MIYENSIQNWCFWMYIDLLGGFFKAELKHHANCKRIRGAGHEHGHDIPNTEFMTHNKI